MKFVIEMAWDGVWVILIRGRATEPLSAMCVLVLLANFNFFLHKRTSNPNQNEKKSAPKTWSRPTHSGGPLLQTDLMCNGICVQMCIGICSQNLKSLLGFDWDSVPKTKFLWSIQDKIHTCVKMKIAVFNLQHFQGGVRTVFKLLDSQSQVENGITILIVSISPL